MNPNELAIQRFVEYIQIKTVQPEPDYDGALKFLEAYANELHLEYSVITIDEERHAAVLTVSHRACFDSIDNDTLVLLVAHLSGDQHRQESRFYLILISMLCPYSKRIGLCRHFQAKFVMARSTDVVHKT
jgi:hypothetical protein